MAVGSSAGKKYRGIDLKDGKIYEFDSEGQPKLTRQDQYSAWISFEQPKPVYRKKTATGSPIRQLAAGGKVRLLFAGRTGAKGWHNVRTADGVEGWLQGAGWEETTFLERIKK